MTWLGPRARAVSTHRASVHFTISPRIPRVFFRPKNRRVSRVWGLESFTEAGREDPYVHVVGGMSALRVYTKSRQALILAYQDLVGSHGKYHCQVFFGTETDKIHPQPPVLYCTAKLSLKKLGVVGVVARVGLLLLLHALPL